MIPIVLFGLAIAIGGILISIGIAEIFTWRLCNKGFATFISIFGLAILGLSIPPLVIWYNQDIQNIKYCKIQYLVESNGEKKQIVICEDEIAVINKHFNQILNNDTIIKKYNYISEKGWVNWMNSDTNHYEIVPPDSPEYQKAKNNLYEVEISKE